MISEAYTGSPTIGTTEYSLPNASTTLTPITVDGVYQVFVDLSAVAPGDTFVIRIKEKVTSGGSQLGAMESALQGEQGATLWASPSLILMNGWDVTIQKEAGTDRSMPYSIRQVA